MVDVIIFVVIAMLHSWRLQQCSVSLNPIISPSVGSVSVDGSSLSRNVALPLCDG